MRQAIAFGTLCALMTPTLTADTIVRTFRTTSYAIDTSADAFADTTARYDVRLAFEQRADNPDDPSFVIPGPSQPLLANLEVGARNISASVTGDIDLFGVRIDNISPTNTDLIIEWGIDEDRDEIDLIDGSINFGYDFDAFTVDDAPRSPTLLATVIDNREVLRFSGGGSGLIADGDSYQLLIELAGQWDPGLEGAGGVDFIGLASSFTITEFFEYDASRDITTFAAFTDDFRQNPLLRFNLLGAVVPSPSTAWLLGAGLLVAARRRR